MLVLTCADGTRINYKVTRSVVEQLWNKRNLKMKRMYDGIDPMSFVLEDETDQFAAWTFSKYWVGRIL